MIIYGSATVRPRTVLFGSPLPPTGTLTPYRSLVVAEKPVVEPVSLAEAKAQARISCTIASTLDLS